MPSTRESRKALVWPAVEDFWRHLVPEVPSPEYVQLTDRAWSDAQWKEHRRVTRCYEGSGVYVHFSEGGEILYVGLTLSGLDRCWTNDSDERRYIDALRFNPKWDFFAPALEVFLIRHPVTTPRNNTLHKRA